MAMTETQQQEFIDEAGAWFDTVHTSAGMQAECERIAAYLDEIGCDDDFEAMCDYFEGISAWEDRTNAQGEFESQLVWLAWGSPYITLDTATGEVWGNFGGAQGTAQISEHARRNINDFFRTLYNC